jgi:hypothetical protein
MKCYRTTVIVWCLLFIALPEAIGQSDRLEMARRYMVRGAAAVEMAKSKEDFGAAAKEFLKAVEIAPELADAWYNLGSVQSKLEQYGDAAASLQKYLDLNPTSSEAQKVRDEIIKLQYRQERHDQQSKPGWTLFWKGDGGDSTYVDKSTIKKDGNKVSIWSLTDSSRPMKLGRDEYHSYKFLYEFDCVSRKSSMATGGFYSGHMGEGGQVASFTPAEPRVWSAIENPLLAKLCDFLCLGADH